MNLPRALPSSAIAVYHVAKKRIRGRSYDLPSLVAFDKSKGQVRFHLLKNNRRAAVLERKCCPKLESAFDPAFQVNPCSSRLCRAQQIAKMQIDQGRNGRSRSLPSSLAQVVRTVTRN